MLDTTQGPPDELKRAARRRAAFCEPRELHYPLARSMGRDEVPSWFHSSPKPKSPCVALASRAASGRASSATRTGRASVGRAAGHSTPGTQPTAARGISSRGDLKLLAGDSRWALNARHPAPVGPLGADLRVAPCVDTGTLVSRRSRVQIFLLSFLPSFLPSSFLPTAAAA